MKKSIVGLMLLIAGVFGGAQRAIAGCMDDAGDAVWGFLSGGASYAACVTAELVNTIRSLIDTVGRLVDNVRRNATEVAHAALGVVRAGADEGRQAFEGAQRSLSGSAAKARQIARSATTVVSSNISSVSRLSSATRTTAQAQAPAPAARPGSQPPLRPGVVAPATAVAPSSAVSAAPAVNLAADPARVRSALTRAADKVSGLESEISRDVASQVNAGLQRAREQAESHARTAGDISRTLLEAPLIALKNSLLDMLAHPERLFDPSATINAQITLISNNIVDTMNRINDAVTRDAVATLNGVEGDIRRAQSNADMAEKIVKAMERLSREKNQVALSQLESLIGGGTAGAASVRPVPQRMVFRADALRGRVDTATLRTIAPLKSTTDSLRSQWAAIEAKRPTKTASLSPRMQQQGKAELDRLFVNKSPAEIQRQKTDLLAKARQRFGSNPQVMAKIEQQLEQEINLRVRVGSTKGVVAPMFKPGTSTQGAVAPQFKPGAAKEAIVPQAPAAVR